MSRVSDAQPIIHLSHVTLRYEHGVTALDDVSLSIRKGERICVLGPNGSGKSTLASVICGLLAPDEGDVSLVGESVKGEGGVDFEAYRRARRQIGLVFQNPDDQIVTSIVEEDVAFGPENLSIPPDEIGLRVERELRRVALERYAKADPSHLSGGQKQRLAIASALACEPTVLVLDEPGALLDVRGRRGIRRVMSALHEAGTTLIHVTHFMDEALDADRVFVMRKGRLILQGTPVEVFQHDEELTSIGLELPFCARLADELRGRGLELPFTCNVDELADALAAMLPDSHARQIVAASHQQDPEQRQSSAAASPGEKAALNCRDVGFSYGRADGREAKHPALADVSFLIRPGASVALVGQTGSGKSTLTRLLCALEVPDSGTVLVGGIDTRPRRNRRRLYGRIGYVMQHPERQLFAETVWEDVSYGPGNLHLSLEEIARRTEKALATVGLTGREKSSPFHLSGGQQRLCAIAGILAMQPHTLVLDEPTAGLDPSGRRLIRQILEEVRASGVTIVQVTHSMEDAARCDQVVVLGEGQLLADGLPGEVFAPANESMLHDAGLGLPEPTQWAMRLGLVPELPVISSDTSNAAPTCAPLTMDELVRVIGEVMGYGA